MKVVKTNQKRRYEYPKTHKNVNYSKIKYRFEDMPRPNHGVTLMQFIEIITNGAIVVTNEYNRLSHTEQKEMQVTFERFTKKVAKIPVMSFQ